MFISMHCLDSMLDWCIGRLIMYFDVFVSVCKYIYIIILVKEKTRYQTKY